jgi:hypothetical protein
MMAGQKMSKRSESWADEPLREVITRTSQTPRVENPDVAIPEAPEELIDTGEQEEEPLDIQAGQEADVDLERQFERMSGALPETEYVPPPVFGHHVTLDERIGRAGIGSSELNRLSDVIYNRICTEIGLESGEKLKEIVTSVAESTRRDVLDIFDNQSKAIKDLQSQVDVLKAERIRDANIITQHQVLLREMRDGIDASNALMTTVMSDALKYHKVLKEKLEAEEADTKSLTSAVSKTQAAVVQLKPSTPAITQATIQSHEQAFPKIKRRQW